MAIKFTDKGIGKVPIPANAPVDYADALTPGLSLVVRPSGSKSWCVRYRYNGKQRRLTLGTYPVISLADARELARDKLKLVELGRDPATEEQVAKRTATEHSYPAIVEAYIRREAMKENKSWAEQSRALGLYVPTLTKRMLRHPPPSFGPPPELVLLPVKGGLAERWADTPVRDITRRQISEAIEEC